MRAPTSNLISNLTAYHSLCSQTIYATIDSYRLGPIGWSPAEQSYYSAALSGVNIVSTQLVSKPLFARLGARRTFQTSCKDAITLHRAPSLCVYA